MPRGLPTHTLGSGALKRRFLFHASGFPGSVSDSLPSPTVLLDGWRNSGPGKLAVSRGGSESAQAWILGQKDGPQAQQGLKQMAFPKAVPKDIESHSGEKDYALV